MPNHSNVAKSTLNLPRAPHPPPICVRSSHPTGTTSTAPEPVVLLPATTRRRTSSSKPIRRWVRSTYGVRGSMARTPCPERHGGPNNVHHQPPGGRLCHRTSQSTIREIPSMAEVGVQQYRDGSKPWSPGEKRQGILVVIPQAYISEVWFRGWATVSFCVLPRSALHYWTQRCSKAVSLVLRTCQKWKGMPASSSRILSRLHIFTIGWVIGQPH